MSSSLRLGFDLLASCRGRNRLLGALKGRERSNDPRDGACGCRDEARVDCQRDEYPQHQDRRSQDRPCEPDRSIVKYRHRAEDRNIDKKNGLRERDQNSRTNEQNKADSDFSRECGPGDGGSEQERDAATFGPMWMPAARPEVLLRPCTNRISMWQTIAVNAVAPAHTLSVRCMPATGASTCRKAIRPIATSQFFVMMLMG